MEQRFYSIASLGRELKAFEQRYGVDSESFYDGCITRQEPVEVDFFDRAVWIDTYEEHQRLLTLALHPGALQPAG